MKSTKKGGGWGWFKNKKYCSTLVTMKVTYDEAIKQVETETNDDKKLEILEDAKIKIDQYKLECVNTIDDAKIKNMVNYLNNEILKYKNNNFDSYLTSQNDTREQMRNNNQKLNQPNTNTNNSGGKRKQTKKRKKNKKSRNNKQ